MLRILFFKQIEQNSSRPHRLLSPQNVDYTPLILTLAAYTYVPAGSVIRSERDAWDLRLVSEREKIGVELPSCSPPLSCLSPSADSVVCT